MLTSKWPTKHLKILHQGEKGVDGQEGAHDHPIDCRILAAIADKAWHFSSWRQDEAWILFKGLYYLDPWGINMGEKTVGYFSMRAKKAILGTENERSDFSLWICSHGSEGLPNLLPLLSSVNEENSQNLLFPVCLQLTPKVIVSSRQNEATGSPVRQ